MVKGAKKPKGKFFGKLDLACLTDIMLAHRSTSDLHLLTDAKLLDALEPLRRDLTKFAHTMVLLEVVDAAFEVESPNPAFYADLVAGLQAFAAASPDLWLPTVLHLRMLQALGLLPAEDSCQECEKPFDGPFYFSSLKGASLCKGCLKDRRGAVLTQSWQVPYLKMITEAKLEECLRLAPSEPQTKQFFGWTRNILDGVVHKRIRSYEFLAQVGLG